MATKQTTRVLKKKKTPIIYNYGRETHPYMNKIQSSYPPKDEITD